MDDFEYKDIDDFDLPESDDIYDDFQGLSDDKIMKKDFTEEELIEFKNKVKEYCKTLLKDFFREGEGITPEDVYNEMEFATNNEEFDKKMFEEFNGQNEMFFECVEKVAQELIDEVNREKEVERREELKSKLEESIEKKYYLSSKVDAVVEFFKENESLKTIDDPDIIRKFIFSKGINTYIASEILDYIDIELIKKDDALMEELLQCWVAPNDNIYEFSDVIVELGTIYGADDNREPYEIYENFGEDEEKRDLSEYYEKFYKKVIDNNINGVGTEDYCYEDCHEEDDEYYGEFGDADTEAFWMMFNKMPSRILKDRGGIDKLSFDEKNYYFPKTFIMQKLIEEEKFEEIKEFITAGEPYTYFYRIKEMSTLPYKYDFDKNTKNKLGKIVIEVIENLTEEEMRHLEKEEVDEEKAEIYENMEETYGLGEDEVKRIKKEIELKRLQEEDQKCDEALEIVEKLEKQEKESKKIEGQEQGENN